MLILLWVLATYRSWRVADVSEDHTTRDGGWGGQLEQWEGILFGGERIAEGGGERNSWNKLALLGSQEG